MLPGETILSGASDTCPDCNEKLPFKVLSSGGGWYIGTFCHCGPYSRESEYFATREQAEQILAAWNEELTFNNSVYSDGGRMLAYARRA